MGYDTNPNDSPDSKASGLYSFLPYLGIAAGDERTQFLLQYQPIVTLYTAYTQNSMQQMSASFTTRPSPRWTWSLGMNGLHGEDSVRPLTSSDTTVVGNVPGSGSGAASYLYNAGVVTNINEAFNLAHDLSLRDGVALRVTNSFNSYSQLHESSGVTIETLNYTHLVRPTLAVLAYQQSSLYYLDFHCTTVGGGIGVTWQSWSHTVMSLQGGPQLNSPGCKEQQGFAYHAYLSRDIRGQSQFYVRSDRQPVNGFLGPGLWQNDFSAGYQRKFLRRNLVGVDFGYAQSSTLTNIGNYKGFFAEGSYTHRLKGPLSLSCRYQNFTSRQGGTPVNRNIVSFSIVVTPGSSLLSN